MALESWIPMMRALAAIRRLLTDQIMYVFEPYEWKKTQFLNFEFIPEILHVPNLLISHGEKSINKLGLVNKSGDLLYINDTSIV